MFLDDSTRCWSYFILPEAVQFAAIQTRRNDRRPLERSPGLCMHLVCAVRAIFLSPRSVAVPSICTEGVIGIDSYVPT
jgi:hypothetical protein